MTPKTKYYVVRYAIERWVRVSAEDEDSAITKAEILDDGEWSEDQTELDATEDELAPNTRLPK